MKSLAFILFFVFASTTLYSQLTVISGPLNSTQLPLLTTTITVASDGNPVSDLAKENVLVLEGDYAAELTKIETESGNKYKISWISAATEYDSIHTAKVLVTYQGETADSKTSTFLRQWPQLRIFNIEDTQISSVYFGAYKPNQVVPFQIKLTGYLVQQNGSDYQPMMVDSIVLNSEYFDYEWKGAPLDPNKKEPPRELRAFDRYYINLSFKPKEQIFYQANLKIYYNGGNLKILPLSGNRFEIENKTSLTLLEPNGGELFAPCQDVLIKWSGHAKTLPVEIFYSIDGGFEWKFITRVMDESYLWKVPEDISSEVMIRIEQPFETTYEFPLDDKLRSAIQKVDFNHDGKRLISINKYGQLTEWSITGGGSPTIAASYYINKNAANDYPYEIKGMFYAGEDNSIAVIYRRSIESINHDSIAIFQSGNENPVKRMKTKDNYTIKKVEVSPLFDTFVTVPEIGAELLVYSLPDAELQNTIIYKVPVTDFKYSIDGNLAIISKMNGEIEIIDPIDFSVQKVLNYSEFEVFEKVSVSSDGNMIAVATMASDDEIRNKNFVIDIKNDRIIREIANNYSSAVDIDFNAVSTMVIMGYPFLPQISIYDMRRQSDLITISPHIGEMLDMDISPEGYDIATASQLPQYLKLFSFSYPEFDVSDDSFKILYPEISIDSVYTESTYVDHSTQHQIEICNSGRVMFDINGIKFRDGVHFATGQYERDTLLPGECIVIDYQYHPKDTGRVADELIFGNCNRDVIVKFESYSIPRTISYLSSNVDFGEVCAEDSLTLNVNLIKNEDPVPLIINDLAFGIYPIEYSIKSISPGNLLAPGEELSAEITFVPREFKFYYDTLTISYASNPKFAAEIPVLGRGIGTNLQVSNDPLLFIPEVLTRDFTITNTSETDIILNNIIIQPETAFALQANLPMDLRSGEGVTVQITSLNAADFNGTISIEAEPCVLERKIPIKAYDGTSVVRFENVQADPRDNAEIKILYDNYENGDYGKGQFFDAEFIIDPAFFLPLDVHSEFGEANLVSNIIQSDRRHIRFRVVGDLPASGIIATVSGKAGLGSKDTSAMEFLSDSEFWGESLDVNFTKGLFTLINVCEDRYLVETEGLIDISSVSPMPADSHIDFAIVSKTNGKIYISINDIYGKELLKIDKFYAGKGTITGRIDLKNMNVGTYILKVWSGNVADTEKIIITR